MKNKFVFVISLAILLISVLGCRFYNPLAGSSDNSANSSNKTLSDKAIDSTVGGEKIGIPECDEVVDFFSEQAKSPDDNFVTKATREYFFNSIRESFKQSIEENKNDKEKMAKECRKYKDQLDKFKAEEESKKQ
jgi:hypothetical protein